MPCSLPLAANREDGLDTFGNVGSLRVPAHYSGAQPLISHQTGANNPFGAARFQQQHQQQQQGQGQNGASSGNLVDF